MKIREARKRAGLSQMALAFKANVSRFRIQLHESGYLDLESWEIARVEEVVQAARAEMERRTNKEEDK